MLKNSKKLLGASVAATDGDVGTINDLYYDDQSWAVRHLVAEAGDSTNAREALLSVQSVDRKHDDYSNMIADGRVPVNITRGQVLESPEASAKLPIARQQESSLFTHYRWAPYWGMDNSSYPFPLGVRIPDIEDDQTDDDTENNLRSMRIVEGYHIAATDGDLGHLEEYIIDLETWLVRYIVVDTRNWLPGRHVLVSTEWVNGVLWPEKKVSVDLEREAIKNAPAYDASKELNRGDEEALYKHYEQTPYWSGKSG